MKTTRLWLGLPVLAAAMVVGFLLRQGVSLPGATLAVRAGVDEDSGMREWNKQEREESPQRVLLASPLPVVDELEDFKPKDRGRVRQLETGETMAIVLARIISVRERSAMLGEEAYEDVRVCVLESKPKLWLNKGTEVDLYHVPQRNRGKHGLEMPLGQLRVGDTCRLLVERVLWYRFLLLAGDRQSEEATELWEPVRPYMHRGDYSIFRAKILGVATPLVQERDAFSRIAGIQSLDLAVTEVLWSAGKLSVGQTVRVLNPTRNYGGIILESGFTVNDTRKGRRALLVVRHSVLFQDHLVVGRWEL